MEYKVVFFERYSISEALNLLEEKVTELQSDGWKPQGGVCVTQNIHSDFYQVYQAMIK